MGRGNVRILEGFVGSSQLFVAASGGWRSSLLGGHLTFSWPSIREVALDVHVTLLDHNGV